jgi:hypothetical protein
MAKAKTGAQAKDARQKFRWRVPRLTARQINIIRLQVVNLVQWAARGRQAMKEASITAEIYSALIMVETIGTGWNEVSMPPRPWLEERLDVAEIERAIVDWRLRTGRPRRDEHVADSFTTIANALEAAGLPAIDGRYLERSWRRAQSSGIRKRVTRKATTRH